MLSFVLGKYLGIDWLDHMADVCLTFKQTTSVFQSTCTLLHSPWQYMQVSCSPTSSQTVGVIGPFNLIILKYGVCVFFANSVGSNSLQPHGL